MDTNGDLARKSKRQAKKCADIGRILIKEEVKARVKQVTFILKKTEDCRTLEDREILEQSPEIVQSIDKRAKVRDTAKQRLLEVEDDADLLESKCEELARVMRNSQNVVIYTGAGISTAASIPDYRGPNGVWTLLQQGKEIKAQDLSDAEPTLTHMAIAELQHQNIVKYVVSQNCDGLHLRSGLSRQVLSEVHGNMFLEVCRECKPRREYIRLFDVTEKTGVRRHSTGRLCHGCDKPLQDTIVHFGEKGGLHSPYNWQRAADAVDDSDVILCLGSSLKILRKYACLWCMDLRPKDRPKLYIVNLQWTPKDDLATLKINGKCDDVLRKVMDKLNMQIPNYKRAADPLFKLSTPLLDCEADSASKKILEIPPIIEPNQFSHAAKSLRRLQKFKRSEKAAITNSIEIENCSAKKSVGSKMTDANSQEFVSSSSSESVIKIDQIEERLPKPTTSKASSDENKLDSSYKLDHPLLRQKLGFSANLKQPLTDFKSCKRESMNSKPIASSSLIEKFEIKKCKSEPVEIEPCQSEPVVNEHFKSERIEINSCKKTSETELCKSERYETEKGKKEQGSDSEQDGNTPQNFRDIKKETSVQEQDLNSISLSIRESREKTLCEDSPNTGPTGKTQTNISNNNKTPTSPGTSLPGWFGKGFNPRKRKRKL